MKKTRQTLPVIALRDLVVMPGMMLHFDIQRKISIAAMEEAMDREQKVFVVMQKQPETNRPGFDDLHAVGTIAVMKQIVRLPENVIRVMITGISRAEMIELHDKESYLEADVLAYEDDSIESFSTTDKEALLRGMKDLVKVYLERLGNAPNTALSRINKIQNLEKLVEEIINNIPVSQEQKQLILNEMELFPRYTCLMVLLNHECEVLRVKNEFQKKVKEKVDQNQKEYVLREQMKVIREELGETNVESDTEIFQKRLEELQASEEVKKKIQTEINRFKSIASNSSEATVSRGYIETLLSLPWDKTGKDTNDIGHARKVLAKDHYGMEKVKQRILEFLAVRTLNGGGNSPIICLVGPPGTGKTSIAKSIAEALSKKYVRICLGGVRDEAEIRGHRRTYVGAMPGRIVAGMKNAGVKNPLMLLDEIDKVSSDYKGDTSSALLEVLDPEQNSHFEDHYVEIPIDLSEVLFIATANTTETIPRPLLDRMELIELSSYTDNEKFHIAKEHLLPKVLKQNGMDKSMLSVSPKAIKRVITGYTREAGVRNLERKLGEIARKAAIEILEKEKETVKVTDKNLEQYLGKEKYSFKEANKEPEVGIVRGLAWTSVGGDTLEIEVNTMPGKGNLILTGKMGEVMQESAKAAISFVRSIADQYNVPKKYFEENDLHVHIPEGAVPKDGPSAGITMATAILSAVTGIAVRSDLAMTGEITLRGRVLPIGGLKEKTIAAKKAGIKEILVPMENKKDIAELEDEILDGMKITFVEQMNQVIEKAFVKGE